MKPDNQYKLSRKFLEDHFNNKVERVKKSHIYNYGKKEIELLNLLLPSSKSLFEQLDDIPNISSIGENSTDDTKSFVLELERVKKSAPDVLEKSLEWASKFNIRRTVLNKDKEKEKQKAKLLVAFIESYCYEQKSGFAKWSENQQKYFYENADKLFRYYDFFFSYSTHSAAAYKAVPLPTSTSRTSSSFVNSWRGVCEQFTNLLHHLHDECKIIAYYDNRFMKKDDDDYFQHHLYFALRHSLHFVQIIDEHIHRSDKDPALSNQYSGNWLAGQTTSDINSKRVNWCYWEYRVFKHHKNKEIQKMLFLKHDSIKHDSFNAPHYDDWKTSVHDPDNISKPIKSIMSQTEWQDISNSIAKIVNTKTNIIKNAKHVK